MSLPYSTSAGLPYGTRVLTIPTGGVQYICNDFDAKQDGQLIERKTELGAPNGAVLLRTAYTGTATLQLAANTTAYANTSMVFSARIEQENTNANFFITGTGAPEGPDQFKTVAITFREVI